MKLSVLRLAGFAVLFLSACSTPDTSPDKTLAGAVLGAGWGAGAGAVVGHQAGGSNSTGPGVAIGAGFGAVSGALTGYGYDQIEESQGRQESELASLKIQNLSNFRQLEQLQDRLDRAITQDIAGGVYQVFFDPDETSLKAGSVADLEVIAETIRTSPAAFVINVVGHSDDSGQPDYNKRLSEARARSVSAYLGGRGISMGQIKVMSFGSERPIASNATPEGRQLNRRVDVYISRN